MAIILLTGCVAPSALRGGRANNAEGIVQQGENPSQPTRQTFERIERFAPIPQSDDVQSQSLPVSSSTITERVTRATTELGAAQKDTSRELSAKFANMRPVQWIGIACLLGAGALAYFGWWTPALIAGGTGLGLILLAHAIVGNERLILILLGAAAAILMVFRSYEKGKLDHILPDSLDKNPK